ncbi:MAG: hypothetical protein QOK25_3052 [Thermoleophilaceae bacterium]|jgi:hypothetical protein|nr:hypothetical protein [Thermoleophilaceae bacterium]
MEGRGLLERSTAYFLALAAPLAIFVWSYLSLWLVAANLCGGDGGSPYAKPGSAQAYYCNHTLDWLGWAWLLAPIVAVGGSTQLVRRRRWALFAIATLIAIGLLLLPGFVAQRLGFHY